MYKNQKRARLDLETSSYSHNYRFIRRADLSSKPKHLLCVDDQSDICELISLILNNYKVTSAGTLAEAMRLASSVNFSLYLLDYHLPDGNGVDLLQLIKKLHAKTPILFVTGTSSMSELQAITIGAQGLVKKNGVDFAEKLLYKVSEVLN